MKAKFSTIEEAREKGAFERGWLPPVLPESAREITESNDLDVNQGEGTFQFSPSDYAALASRLTPAPAEVVARNWASYTAKGFAIFTHTKDDTLWMLALHSKGEGYYTVGANR